MLDAGVRVGLGVDGSASNERSDLCFDVKQALLVARARGGPTALTSREALRLATRGGAAVLARDDIGVIAPGKCADLAVWSTDGLELGGAADPGRRRSSSRRRTGSSGCTSAASSSSTAAPLARADEDGDRARSIGVQARRFAAVISLSTHVLDTGAGRPAADVEVTVYRGDDVVAEQRTDADGRARLADDARAGPLSHRFRPPSPFFRRVELEVELEEGHYHVPLLVSPYGCASYRGS